MDLNNKVAVITGATGGLGAAMAKALVHKNSTVYGIGRNERKLNELKNELGDKFVPVVLDLTKAELLEKWIHRTFSEDYAPDILINNAGIGSYHSIDDTPMETWLKMVDINLNGTYYITSEVVRLMKQKTSYSHIINIGSILGTVGRPNTSAYSATKFAMNGFSEALFMELRPFNIKVTCINPGSIETDFFKSSGVKVHDNMLHPADLANTVVHVLETPDGMLINELTVRPLHPNAPTN